MLKDAFEAAFFLDLEFSKAEEMTRFLKDAHVEIYCGDEGRPRVSEKATDLQLDVKTSYALVIMIYRYKKAGDPDLSRIVITIGDEVKTYAIRRSGVPSSKFYEIVN